MDPLEHKIEAAPTGRAACRGCKKPIAKGELRFGEAFQNGYSEDGGVSFRYWHLRCAASAATLAHELRGALGAYEARQDHDPKVPDREELELLIQTHARPPMPHAERAPNGRAKCRACDQAIKKGELRVAFERVFESPMGPTKGAAYAHPSCVRAYLEREREREQQRTDERVGDSEHGNQGTNEGQKPLADAAARERETMEAVLRNSKLSVDDLDLVARSLSPVYSIPIQ